MSFPNRIVVVTGAGSGIGRRTSIALAHVGFNVILAGRHPEALEQVAGEIPASCPRPLVVRTDVTDPASVQELFGRIKQVFGRLDVLFNNAGMNLAATAVEEVSLDAWNAMIAVNLTGAFLCAQKAFKLMKEQSPQGGRIINNGSISAHVPRPQSAAYTATKHAMTGLTKSLALDGRPFRIACGQIDIGNAATQLTERMETGVLQSNGSIATEPTIDADHVARAVVYMATLPLEANVLSLTVMATQMPFVGRG